MLFVSAHKITVFFFYKKQFIEPDKKGSVSAESHRIVSKIKVRRVQTAGLFIVYMTWLVFKPQI